MRDDVPTPYLAPRTPAHEGPAAADLPDAVLTGQIAAGDYPALDTLYRRHKAVVYRFALLWTGSAATAADVTQDVFVHLLTRAADFDASLGALPNWLLGIARNFARRRSGVVEGPATEHDHATAEPPPEAALEAKRSIESLRRAISTLPPVYRDVLVLVELAERSYAEAALICNCELNTIRSRLFRARGLLAQRIALEEAPVDSPAASHLSATKAARDDVVGARRTR